MSSEPVHIPVVDGDVWVWPAEPREGGPTIQLDVAGGVDETASASLSLEDAAMVAGELLMARQRGLAEAASRARRVTRPWHP